MTQELKLCNSNGAIGWTGTSKRTVVFTKVRLREDHGANGQCALKIIILQDSKSNSKIQAMRTTLPLTVSESDAAASLIGSRLQMPWLITKVLMATGETGLKINTSTAGCAVVNSEPTPQTTLIREVSLDSRLTFVSCRQPSFSD